MTWATSVSILVFLGLCVFELDPMYVTDKPQTDRRQTASSLNVPAYQGRGHNDYDMFLAIYLPRTIEGCNVMDSRR